MTGRRTSQRLRRPSLKAIEAAKSAESQACKSSKPANVLKPAKTQPTKEAGASTSSLSEEVGPSTIPPSEVKISPARPQTQDSINEASKTTSRPAQVSSQRPKRPRGRKLSTSAKPVNTSAPKRGPLSTVPVELAQVPAVPDLAMPLRLSTFLGVSPHRLPAPIVAPANGRSSLRRQRRQNQRDSQSLEASLATQPQSAPAVTQYSTGVPQEPPAPLTIDPQLCYPHAYVAPAQLQTVPTTPPNSATADAFVFGTPSLHLTPLSSGVSPGNGQEVSPFTQQGSGDVVMYMGYEEDEAEFEYLNGDSQDDFDFNLYYGPSANYPQPPQ